MKEMRNEKLKCGNEGMPATTVRHIFGAVKCSATCGVVGAASFLHFFIFISHSFHFSFLI